MSHDVGNTRDEVDVPSSYALPGSTVDRGTSYTPAAPDARCAQKEKSHLPRSHPRPPATALVLEPFHQRATPPRALVCAWICLCMRLGINTRPLRVGRDSWPSRRKTAAMRCAVHTDSMITLLVGVRPRLSDERGSLVRDREPHVSRVCGDRKRKNE